MLHGAGRAEPREEARESLGAAGSRRIFASIDGPRDDQPEDPQRCARVREVYDEVLDTAPRHGFQQVRTSIASYDRLLDQAPDYASLEGVVAANILIDALKRTGTQLDTEKLVDTLEAMRYLRFPTFSDETHAADMPQRWTIDGPV